MKVEVPDLRDFADVPIIEVLVAVGDEVEAEDPLIVLESDKATMEIPAPAGGVDGAQPAPREPDPGAAAQERVDVVVVGSGPGGYTAAFRAADLGLEVVLVERHERLGGVCLNVGCIPSKALLHVAKLLTDGQDAAAHGVTFGPPSIDLEGVRAFKQGAVDRLTGGVDVLAKGRKVRVVNGEARFTGPHELTVGDEAIAFEHCIVAAGSSSAAPPNLPDDPRVMGSTRALALADVPDRLLVVGGGVICLELATVYDALGSEVTVVELTDQLLPGTDPDLVRLLHRRIEERYAAIHLGATIETSQARDDGIHVTLTNGVTGTFDRVLVAVGRRPNGATLGLDAAGVHVDEHGFVPADEQQRTNVAHIFAIGDICRPPLLAHKAMHEGKVAAEVIAGQNVAFEPRATPSIAYTDPEVAWAGLTETEAKAAGTPYELARMPWTASGRALAMGRPDGLTKLLVDPDSKRILGVGIVGTGAGELLAEVVHAIEMDSDAEDVARSIHPHPTLSESVGIAAEVAAGVVTDLPQARRRAA